MCLAIPARVLSIEENTAEIDMEGNRSRADVTFLPEVREGDFILVHAGLGIQIYDEEEAQETLKLIRSMVGREDEP